MDENEDQGGTTVEAKRGRGRPRKDGTVGPANKKSSSAKKTGYTVEELQTKLNILIGGLAKILGNDYVYGEDDYKQEAAALVRMSTKFEIVSQAIALFDPVLVVLGLFTKLSTVFKKPKKENEDVEKEKAQYRNVVGLNG